MRLDRSPFTALLVAASVTAMSAACGAGGSSLPVGPPSGATVALVGGAPIAAVEVAAEMRRAGSSSRQALRAVVDFELLAGAAAASIGAGDPDVEEARRRAMVQRLLERELEPQLGESAIPERDLRQVYEKARSVFVHPRLVEIAILSIYTGARMKDEPRARALEAARALDAAVRALPGAAPEDWKTLAEQPVWRERRVKYARTWQALDEPFSAEVGRAVAALARPGDTTPLITAESGFHVARYIAERPPESVTFEQATPTLRHQIYERWRQGRFAELVQAMAGPHQVEAFPERLDPAAPAN